MKKSSDYPWVNFRPGTPLYTRLQARVQGEESISQRAKQDLQDYHRFLSFLLPPFTHRERAILREALNGWEPTIESVQFLWVEVEAVLRDTLDDSLLDRIKSLHPFECWAIVQAFQEGKL